MRKADATKSRIQRVALELFAEKGVDQTTTRDLAAGAGIAEGTIYRHYRSKDALIGEMFRHHYGALATRLQALSLDHGSLRQQIAAMVEEFCRLFESDPALFRFLFFVQHGQLEQLPPAMPTPVTVICGAIEAAIARGEIPERDPELATALLLGAVTQPAVFRTYGRVRQPLTAVSGDIAAACWRLISS